MMSLTVSQTLYKRRGVTEFAPPKSANSRRTVGLTPKLALFLRQFKSEREWQYLQLGKTLSGDDLVFAKVTGEPLDPSDVTHEFKRIALSVGMTDVHVHTLRHSFCSLMLMAGTSPQLVSQMMGHSTVAFTLQTYGHILSGMRGEAMSRLDSVLPASLARDLITPK